MMFSSCGGKELPANETTEESGTAGTSAVLPDDGTVYHRVVLNTNGGSYMPPQLVADGDTVLAGTPERNGFSFEGWFDTAGRTYDFSIPVTEDGMLIAHWKRLPVYTVTDTAGPSYAASSAVINAVWLDYGDAAKKRPESVKCTFTVQTGGQTESYRVVLRADLAVWDGPSPAVGTLTTGAGSWTARISGLDKNGVYTFTADKPEGEYSLLQSGTAAVYTVKGYKPSQDKLAGLMTMNGRLYDMSGNLISLRGVVSLNAGYVNFPKLVSVKALQRLKNLGVNCLRLSLQLTSDSGTGAGYVTNGASVTSAERRAELEGLVDTAVQNGTNLGLYVIIDWGVLAVNPNDYLDEASDFFTRMAEKYKNNPRVIFEICNEPVAVWGLASGENGSVRRYEEKIISAIRSTGNTALIIAAPNASATALSLYSTKPEASDDPVDDPISTELSWNVAHTFHCYPYNYPFNDVSATSYGWKLQDAARVGLTLVVTEFSPIKANLSDGRDETVYDIPESEKYLNYFLENDMSFCCFRYNFLSEGSALSQWVFFKPGVDPSIPWTRDDMTDTGKWFYDILTADGVIRAADFKAPRHQ